MRAAADLARVRSSGMSSMAVFGNGLAGMSSGSMFGIVGRARPSAGCAQLLDDVLERVDDLALVDASLAEAHSQRERLGGRTEVEDERLRPRRRLGGFLAHVLARDA